MIKCYWLLQQHTHFDNSGRIVTYIQDLKIENLKRASKKQKELYDKMKKKNKEISKILKDMKEKLKLKKTEPTN